MRIRAWASRVRATAGVDAVSDAFGADRGTAILRHYTMRFLEEFRADVRGRCLEFEEPAYTRLFGGGAVSSADVIHVEHGNPAATIVADLTGPNDLRSAQFDCIICTFVLHLVYDYETLVHELRRLLRPGGALLVAVPCTSMADPGWHEMWRFTPEGLDRLLRGAFGACDVTVRAYGNSLTAAAQMRGLAAEEFTRAELEHADPRFAVVVCARAVRAGEDVADATDWRAVAVDDWSRYTA